MLHRILVAVSGALMLVACEQAPNEIATVSFVTPEGVRNLRSYPAIKRSENNNPLDLVTTSFCVWVGAEHGGGQLNQWNKPPEKYILQCYFDTDWKQPLHADTRLTLRLGWGLGPDGNYQRTETSIKTAYNRGIARTRRNNCQDDACGIVFHTLSFPKNPREVLAFDFTIETPIVKNNPSEDVLFTSKFHFVGAAKFHRSI